MGYYDCPECNMKLRELRKLVVHFEALHEGVNNPFTIKQYLFHKRSSLPKAQMGRCKWEKCKDPANSKLRRKVNWIENTGRYESFCSNQCAKNWNDNKKKQIQTKYGKPHLMNDVDHQKKMMRKRKGYGVHTFSNGYKLPYFYAYEQDFLKYLDKEYPKYLLDELKKDGFKSNRDIKNAFDIQHMMSGMDDNITVFYEYLDGEGKLHTYIPDFYYEPFDLVIEIKHGGAHPNGHPGMIKDNEDKNFRKLDAIIRSRKHNFIKVTDKRYDGFERLMHTLRYRYFDIENNVGRKIMVIDD